ncbi:carbon-nitrogen family hydrolase [bacterium]|nr:MAG: carbon-nitrogen family hydrolase [bacterium]
MKPAKHFNIHLVQWNVLAGQLEDNLARADELVGGISPDEGDLVLLPEMFSSGFYYADLEKMADRSSQTVEWMSSLAVSRSVAVAGSLPMLGGDGVANTLVMRDRTGKRTGSYVKVHLFPLTGEMSAFHPGGSTTVSDWNETCIGFMICFDLRFPEFARKICLEGARIIIVSAQWPRARIDHFVDLVKVRAMENQIFVAAVNSNGDDGSGLVLGGNSLVTGPMGEVVGQMDNGDGVLSVPIDLGEVERVRKEFPVLSLRRPDVY